MRPPYLRALSGPCTGETHEPRHDDSNYDQCTEGDALHGAVLCTGPAPHCETSRPLGTTHGEGGHPDNWTEDSRSYSMWWGMSSFHTESCNILQWKLTTRRVMSQRQIVSMKPKHIEVQTGRTTLCYWRDGISQHIQTESMQPEMNSKLIC